ncbi:Uncharacterized vancomycin resistance protein [Slackia heliotrinireducens]|uniref:Ykud domain-containing protein n=1 Tax=Slackia heliotrinireducens (strain ATCC 29202 / DSM 20476 / NCTC 11029 / RHS 1) TaxID=471855 RepID=C7N511_SLAHD|nr:L,D-transpeptidase [Slackia heliotrinireducens]ACV21996.1 Ykud domain-containing protein [Slackia heliotrinireducens DSM 20476]VEG99892.1 Uncharacterized vancomycin resistance protein [Slackia heliotrinireducens]
MKHANVEEPAEDFAAVNPAGIQGSIAGYSRDSYAGRTSQKNGKGGRVALITFGIFAAIAGAAYGAGAYYFGNHFYPNTTMGPLDLSLATHEEVISQIEDVESYYSINVKGEGIDFNITSADGGIDLDAESVVKAAADTVDKWKWPVQVMDDHDLTEVLVASSSGDVLSGYVAEQVATFNEPQTVSEDAYITYKDAEDAFVIVDEVYGTQINPDAVLAKVESAIVTLDETCEVTEDDLIKPQVLATDETLVANCQAANDIVACDALLVSDVTGAEITRVNADVVSQWVVFDESGVPSLDEAAMTEWASGLADGMSTIGTERTYERPDGKTVTVSGGDYGWSISSDAIVEAVTDSVLNHVSGEVDIEATSSGNGYVSENRDWGSWVDVDLSEQHAYLYDASGNLLWDSPIITGKTDGHQTPTGVYYLKAHQTNVVLKGQIDPETNEPEYESHVEYWMPFIGNAVGMHDAPWQSDAAFADPNAYTYRGSHGCVNLPPSKAEALFGLIDVGICVVSHY